VIGATLGGSPTLYVSQKRGWRPTLAVPRAAAINGIGQLDDQRFVLVGRATSGTAYVAVYDAGVHQIVELPSPAPRPLLAVASDAYAATVAGAGHEGRDEKVQIASLPPPSMQ